MYFRIPIVFRAHATLIREERKFRGFDQTGARLIAKTTIEKKRGPDLRNFPKSKRL